VLVLAADGLSEPTGNCSGGWYCTGTSYQSMPIDTGNTTDPSMCSCPAGNYTGGICWPGTYCAAGTSYPEPCMGGYYCSQYGLSTPEDKCSPGYYCLSGATTPNDTLCTANHYCEEGSAAPTPCPPGSFSSATGNIALANCEQCSPGSYCLTSAGIDGPCDPGFYCPAGQSSATPASYDCPAGHYCPGGEGTPRQCPAGTYQDQTGQTFCRECPVGKYVLLTVIIVFIDYLLDYLLRVDIMSTNCP